MDGTLIDSTAGVEGRFRSIAIRIGLLQLKCRNTGAWRVFAQSYPGIDVHEILSCTRRYLSGDQFSH